MQDEFEVTNLRVTKDEDGVLYLIISDARIAQEAIIIKMGKLSEAKTVKWKTKENPSVERSGLVL